MQQCKKYINLTGFSRVMIINVLPRFFMKHILLLLLLHRESKKGCHPNRGYNPVNS